MKSTKVSNSIIENFKQTLSAYLSELSSENISLISESIIKNYINHKSNIESRKIYDILLIYSKKEVRSISYYLKKWKRKVKINNKIRNYNFDISPIKNNIYNEKKNSQTYIFKDLEDEKIILNNINSNLDFNKISSISSISSSNSQLKSKNNSKLNLKNKKYNTRNIKTTIYDGERNNKSKKNNDWKITNFIQRQEIFRNTMNKDKEKLYKDNEDEYELICTFNPKINKYIKNHRSNSISIYNRIYQDGIDRKKKKDKIEKKYLKKSSINLSISNQAFFDELYLDYKNRKKNHKILENKIDYEKGITFTPDIYHTPKKNLLQYNNGKEYNKIKLFKSCSDKEINFNYNNNKYFFSNCKKQ